MTIAYRAIKENAARAVREEVRSQFHMAVKTVSAFVVLGIEEKDFRSIDLAVRQSSMKKSMTQQGMTNGTAAAYSKLAEAHMSELIQDYGKPIVTGADGVANDGSTFWAEWRDAETVMIRQRMVEKHIGAKLPKAVDHVGKWCDVYDIIHGQNVTAQATQAKLAQAIADNEAQKAEKEAARQAEKAAKKEAERESRIIALVNPPVEGGEMVTEDDDTTDDTTDETDPVDVVVTVETVTPAREAVLAALLDLSPEDQAWIMAAMAAISATAPATATA